MYKSVRIVNVEMVLKMENLRFLEWMSMGVSWTQSANFHIVLGVVFVI